MGQSGWNPAQTNLDNSFPFPNISPQYIPSNILLSLHNIWFDLNNVSVRVRQKSLSRKYFLLFSSQT